MLPCAVGGPCPISWFPNRIKRLTLFWVREKTLPAWLFSNCGISLFLSLYLFIFIAKYNLNMKKILSNWRFHLLKSVKIYIKTIYKFFLLFCCENKIFKKRWSVGFNRRMRDQFFLGDKTIQQISFGQLKPQSAGLGLIHCQLRSCS